MTMFKKTERLYISGAMSGIKDMNFPLFNATAEKLRALGYEVVNPVDLNPDPNADWLECIATDLLALRPCDGICMLPGWEASFGARIEHLAAQKEGMNIYKLEDLIPEVA